MHFDALFSLLDSINLRCLEKSSSDIFLNIFCWLSKLLDNVVEVFIQRTVEGLGMGMG